MSIADELEKLQRLHDSGALTEQEFAEAKAAVLDDPAPAPTAEPTRVDEPVAAPSSAQASVAEWPREDPSVEAFGFHDARNESSSGDPEDSLGHAANRYVDYQIFMSVIGLIVFLLVFLLVFLPAFNSIR
jgi:hypothetical protein